MACSSTCRAISSRLGRGRAAEPQARCARTSTWTRGPGSCSGTSTDPAPWSGRRSCAASSSPSRATCPGCSSRSGCGCATSWRRCGRWSTRTPTTASPWTSSAGRGAWRTSSSSVSPRGAARGSHGARRAPWALAPAVTRAPEASTAPEACRASVVRTGPRAGAARRVPRARGLRGGRGVLGAPRAHRLRRLHRRRRPRRARR
mmetsp:Transcript_52444/g.145376  ORF Transcript_52444/g.145376 Transcript_52444/m.145376 type:complete len:203 (-) Transcript_52444:393-1001(-)